jgi:hypothetical protein
MARQAKTRIVRADKVRVGDLLDMTGGVGPQVWTRVTGIKTNCTSAVGMEGRVFMSLLTPTGRTHSWFFIPDEEMVRQVR